MQGASLELSKGQGIRAATHESHPQKKPVMANLSILKNGKAKARERMEKRGSKAEGMKLMPRLISSFSF